MSVSHSQPVPFPTQPIAGPSSSSPRSSPSSTPTHSLDLPSLLPLSHTHPLLSCPTFSADTFLLSRLHIPLEELRAELREYLGQLREELIGLINEDYEEFISLGTGLRGERERLEGLLGPLEGVRGDVGGVMEVLLGEEQKVEAGLGGRGGVREEEALLDLLQRLFDTLTRAENLLSSHSHNQPEESDEDRAKLVQRVAGEYTQLVYLLDKARQEGCKIVATVEPRVEVIKTRLSGDLAGLLDNAIPDRGKVKACLRTYDVIEGWEEAVSVVRKRVRTWCSDNITPTALAPEPSSPVVPKTPYTPHTPSRRSNPFESPAPCLGDEDKSSLAKLYNNILGEVASLVPLMEEADAISEEFGIFERVVWVEISVAIQERLGGTVFAAGRPDELHRHYTTTHRFLHLLESLAPSARAVVAMRDSPSFAEFERRWQLPVYFQLRWKEIIGSFEIALVPVGERAAGKDGWTLASSEAAWRAISRCWDEGVWVEELGGRFWRLSLQIVSRYTAYLRTTMDGFKIGDEASQEDDAALRFAASVIVDGGVLEKRVTGLAPMQHLGVSEYLAIPITPFVQPLLSILIQRCSDPLKQVRSVVSQLRVSSATASKSVQPSYFIPAVLQPLVSLYGSYPTLKDSHGRQWSEHVIDEVFKTYGSILGGVRKTEDLLRRVKSKKGGFSLFGGAAKEEDKGGEEERFKRQMEVDLERLREGARGLGVDVEELQGWKEVKEVVDRPAE